MKVIAVTIGVALAIAGLGWLIKSRIAEQYEVRLSDIPRVFEQIALKGAEGAFAVFMFSDRGQQGQEGQVNIQFSVENGKVGLDWVVMGSVNVRDEQRIFDFLQARGSMPIRTEQNGVKYIRAEEGELSALCQRIIGQLYRVRPEDDIDLVPDGFEWGG